MSRLAFERYNANAHWESEGRQITFTNMLLVCPTCVPSDPVEHLIPYARLELSLDLVEVRYPTIVHELGRNLDVSVSVA